MTRQERLEEKARVLVSRLYPIISKTEPDLKVYQMAVRKYLEYNGTTTSELRIRQIAFTGIALS